MCMGGSIYIFKITPKRPGKPLGHGSFSSTIANLYITKGRKKGEKEIELHRNQQDHSLQFSASGPVQGKTIETPTSPQKLSSSPSLYPPTYNQYPVSLENLPGRVLYK